MHLTSTDSLPSESDDGLRPIPLPDGLTNFFWDAAAEGRLSVQQCEACGRLQYPPDVVCTECQSESLGHIDVSGRGTLYSFAIVDRAFHPGFVSHLPYVVALVELAEQPGLRIVANVIDADPQSVTVGMPVEVCFERRREMSLPQFRPVKMAP
jgi:uncharacterized OB-fold protein